MIFSHHEFWTIVHGMLLGSLYLISFAGGAEGLWSLRPGFLTEEGIRRRLKRLKIGIWTMTLTCWLAVLTGTFVVYVWYRAKIPESPRSRLLADPAKAAWHTFGMEWKEHVSWIAPILTTAVAFIVSRYGRELMEREEIRKATFWLFAIAFAAAGVGGLFGAFLNKVVPFF